MSRRLNITVWIVFINGKIEQGDPVPMVFTDLVSAQACQIKLQKEDIGKKFNIVIIEQDI